MSILVKMILLLVVCQWFILLLVFLHFCDEGGENLLVYEYLSNRSLDLHLNNADLSWDQRLIICVGAAMGLQYLHEPVEGSQQRVLHRDIKSANILLDHNWKPKIADFGLSKLGPANQKFSFLFSNAVGTIGYCDPLYAHTGFLTKESDVYSFGVVLFEVLCGRPTYVQNYDDIHKSLTALSRKCYEEKKMDTIIHASLRDNISPKCLERFTAVAYQCLQLDHTKRPTMGKVVEELRCALGYQSIHQKTMQKFELKQIEVATDNFKLYIGQHKYGERIYEGKLSIFEIPTRVFIMRFSEHSELTPSYYLEALSNSTTLHHPNYISTLGYCNEEREEIIVYEYPERGSLDQYIRRNNASCTTLTWQQRLEICTGAGHGLIYLHSKNIIETGFKSAFILLDDKWVAKIGDLEIARECSTGLDRGAVIEQAYNSPEYIINGRETPENNVYSFGVVLFETLCGRLFTEEVDGYTLSAKLIKRLYKKKKLEKNVDPVLREEKISAYSVDKYSAIAYQCLSYNPQERPSMDDVVKVLEELLSIERQKELDGREKVAADREETNQHVTHSATTT